ncbi:MAG: VWA domain-containing protein [Gammaproteobacteria bacterium]
MSLKSIFLVLSLGLCLFGKISAMAQEPDAPQDSPPAVMPGDEEPAGDAVTADGDGLLMTFPRDVVLVLDNSGSMKKNDPGSLAVRAVREFVSRLEAQTRLAIIIFDQDVHLSMPLARVSDQTRERIADSIDRLDYGGLFTDSPAAIERAIYELKNNGREDAQKFIVFITDGIVDTGNEGKDMEKTRWLREDLAPDAADANIRIFGIAFTEAADFQLIQSLAQKTGGEYYRALQPEDLQSVFGRIQTLMQEPPEEELPEEESVPEQPVEQAPPQPVVINVPEQPVQSMGEEERIRSIIIIASAAVLVLALIVIIVLLIRHNRGGRGDEDAHAVEAYLNDIHGHTTQPSFKLGNKPTMLGRVAGKDTDHLDYIVIPQSTIGRRHALIEYKDFAYWIVDQGSINGTYVNDVPISSEVRLKHGDKIRLHKLEFEFLMPEMDEAGMTELSSTVFAQQGSEEQDEATELRDHGSGKTDEDAELGFDLADEGDEDNPADDEEDTLLREDQAGHEGSSYDSEDETLIPGSEDTVGEGSRNPDDESEDETLMPGEFDFPDEDETLRHDASDESMEDLFDLTDVDKKGNNDKDKS